MDPRIDLLRSRVRDVPDFPKPGIVFKDITPLLGDPAAFEAAIALMAEPWKKGGEKVDVVVGIESRGFIFGAPLALRLGAGFVPVRKPGKLPYERERVEYALEYGHDVLEMHIAAIPKGARVLIVDDVIATGGTAWAARELVTRQGGNVIGAAFLVELSFLPGRARVAPMHCEATLIY
jgi:adenine phosphoribosyltransferase